MRRLKSSSDFKRVFAGGEKTVTPSFVVYSCAGSGAVGVSVSKRVGGSVVRNAVKRRIREAVASLPQNQNCDLIVVAKPTSNKTPFREIVTELQTALPKANFEPGSTS